LDRSIEIHHDLVPRLLVRGRSRVRLLHLVRHRQRPARLAVADDEDRVRRLRLLREEAAALGDLEVVAVHRADRRIGAVNRGGVVDREPPSHRERASGTAAGAAAISGFPFPVSGFLFPVSGFEAEHPATSPSTTTITSEMFFFNPSRDPNPRAH
jgi:hypothetical protein